MGKHKNNVTGRLLMIFGMAGFVYLVFNLVVCQVNISTKQQELNTVQDSLNNQLAENEELERELSGSDSEIIERAARDELGYARPNERVFVDVSGK